MIRWLLLVPFALLIAIGMSSVFFFIASMVDPLMATLTGETLFVGFWNLVDAVFSSDDPGPIVAEAMLTVGRIMFTLLVLPPLVIAVTGEALKMRSLFWYALATGVLTAAVPWILRGAARVANPAELHVSAILGLTGAVAGFVYWVIAGRDAGGRTPPPPPPASSLPSAEKE
ncbi:hypothetical protein [Microvirga makkahensis]|uniref:Uncharacterized protein n=1 Tax=Microvirga makkahensis TaxID=1128670 RepID=A0A7X3SQC1_9HYPH|nr:hypothetical protein [Microvirga makkahensis]MXQ13416.1 hypothetical protein [Microvirga makkahensis]